MANLLSSLITSLIAAVIIGAITFGFLFGFETLSITQQPQSTFVNSAQTKVVSFPQKSIDKINRTFAPQFEVAWCLYGSVVNESQRQYRVDSIQVSTNFSTSETSIRFNCPRLRFVPRDLIGTMHSHPDGRLALSDTDKTTLRTTEEPLMGIVKKDDALQVQMRDTQAIGNKPLRVMVHEEE